MHLVARKSGSHIDSLHEQILKGRTVKVTEDPSLHLVWYKKELYVKPIPHCLLSYAFWAEHLITQDQQSKPSKHYFEALGFVRSYSFLICHESDFRLAQASYLIPKDLAYADFSTYIDSFRAILDIDVSCRWKFGQLRLTRLDWAVRFFRPQSRRNKTFLQNLFYRERYWSVSQVIEESAAPLLFLFVSVSLILSAMQVVLAARTTNPWVAFVEVSWGFSITIIVLLATVLLSFIILVTHILVWQLSFAILSQNTS